MFANQVTAVKTPEIQLELQELEKSCAEVLAMVSELENRLSCIMREPEPEISRDGEARPGAYQSGSMIASLLRQRRTETKEVARKIDQILRRIDV